MPEAGSLALLPTSHHAQALAGSHISSKSTAGAHRPRTREVTSRYKSSTPTTSISPGPRRFPTPTADCVGTVPDVPSPKRAQSAERRRSSPSRAGETKASSGSLDAVKRPPVRTELLWPSTKSLPTSLHAESCTLVPPNGTSKTPVDVNPKTDNKDLTLWPPVETVRRSPEYSHPTLQLDQAENAKPQENVNKVHLQCLPMGMNAKLSGSSFTRSVDFSLDKERRNARAGAASVSSSTAQIKRLYGSSRVPRPVGPLTSFNESPTALQKATRVEKGRESPRIINKSLDEILHSEELPAPDTIKQTTQAVELPSLESFIMMDHVSDTESVSSGGFSATSLSRGGTPVRGGVEGRSVRGTTVPARFLQDAASRSKRASENNKLRASMTESDFSEQSGFKSSTRYKSTISSESSSPVSTASSSPWFVPSNRSISGLLLPQRAISPARTLPYRSMTSPARSRGTPPPHRSSSAALMLTFLTDTRKGNKGMSQVEEAHFYRILHNRLLQWRFVNARASAALDAQTSLAEKLLKNVCSRTCSHRTSVMMKHIQLQQAIQAYRLGCLLSFQTPKLEEWSSLEEKHSDALIGALQALEAAVVQVPVIGVVKVESLAIKEAIGSACDVMSSVESSVNYMLAKADKAYCLVSELANVVRQERGLLAECADLIWLANILEVEECSMFTHLFQLEYEKVRVLGHLMDSAMSLVAQDTV